MSGAVSPPFEFDVQDPWRRQAGSTETRLPVFHPSSNDVELFQASPWLLEGENSGFGTFVTPGSTTNICLPGACGDSLDAQVVVKSSDQDPGFGNPLSRSHWNSSGNLGSQSWAVSIPTRFPRHAITRPVTFGNNFMDIGIAPNSYAQGINYSAPDSNVNLHASNVPAIGPHSLDFFSRQFILKLPSKCSCQHPITRRS